jgi:squalene synthase HpnC
VITSLYRFARVGDDLADEGHADAASRRADLCAYAEDLRRVYDREPVSSRWPEVFHPLEAAVHTHGVPQALLQDLLDAFLQDVDNPTYPDRTRLLDYCRRSANPVGRLLLHLYGAVNERNLQESDAICTALQLINFWQDLSIDLPRGRVYLPQQDLQKFGLDSSTGSHLQDGTNSRALVKDLCMWTRGFMEQGAALPGRLPGRVGWELRLVVQGGLRVLEKIEAMDFATFSTRPLLSHWDLGITLWRSVTRPPILKATSP